MVEDETLGEDFSYYDLEHEIIGPCNKCGFLILDGCRGDTDKCKASHTGPGGWVSTKHGHLTWCSQVCRDADDSDPERKENDALVSDE